MSARRLPAALLLLTVCACGGGTPAPHAGPRRIMLRDVALNVVVPSYEALVTAADAQVVALRGLEAQPGATTLVAAQTAWRRARSAWKQTEAFAFGPAATLRSAAKIDWAPVRDDRIERAIAASSHFDSADVEDLGANVKGLLALEYVLFAADGDDTAVLASLTGDAATPRRAYARALAENIRDQSVLLRDAWSPNGGNFAAELADAGQGSAAYAKVKDAVDAVVNQLIFLSSDIAVRQLQAPLGTDAAPRPDLIVSARSHSGLADVLDDVTGIQNVYFGTYQERTGSSLSRIADSLSPPTNTAIEFSLQRVFTAAAGLDEPLEDAVASDRAAVERTRVRAAELMRHLEIDLVSVLGTTLRFNPGDGD